MKRQVTVCGIVMSMKYHSEALRQLQTTSEMIESDEVGRARYMEAYREMADDVGGSLMLDLTEHFATNSLIFGQGLFRIHKDFDLAKATFKRVCDWAPFLIESLKMLSRSSEHAMPSWDRVLKIALCVILASDREGAISFANEIDDGFFLPLKKKSSQSQFFTKGLIRSITNETYEYSEPAQAGRAKIMTHGYGRLLSAALSNDVSIFNSVIAEIFLQYKKRGGSKEGSLDAFGYGEISQFSTIDVIGTALCKIAKWRGMSGFVLPDGNFYPDNLID